MIRLRALTVAALACAAIAAAGCGVSTEGTESIGQTGAAPAPQSTTTAQRLAALPPRQDGVIRIDGKAQGSLTPNLVSGYEASGGASEVRITSDDEGAAYRAFCAGRTDIVDAARPISAAEYAACSRNGIRPVQIQTASDAVVLAIKNETDVGVDCISLADVRNIFRAGSPITNWSQVGYGKPAPGEGGGAPLRVTGPDAKANAFGFFGRSVLGDPDASLLSLRSDYQAHPNDRGVRLEVTGKSRDQRDAARSDASRRDLSDLKQSIGDAVQAVGDARSEVAKGIRDGRPPAQKAEDRATLEAAREKVAKLRSELPAARRTASTDRAAAARIARTRGTLGLFRFSYYELFEEQLRPMEIDAGDFDPPECIFPSEQTVTNATYPLARQLLLTVRLKTMKDADVNEFLAYVLRHAKQAAVTNGLVPLPDSVRLNQMQWLRGNRQPDVVYYPPSEIRTARKAESRKKGESGSEG